MNSTRLPIRVVLRSHMLAQPRKSAVLILLLVVMAVVYLRLFLKDSGPEAAQAGVTPIILPVQPQPAAAGVPMKRYQPDRPLVRELARDPFQLQLDRYAVDPDAPAAPVQADAPAATRPAGGEGLLQLQGTLCGESRMAWINGRCVHLGEEIAGYTLEKIEPTQVTLQRDGLQRVLSME